MSPRAASRILTPEQAAHAIHLDYEGNVARPPTLVGWLIGEDLCQAIVGPAFVSAAGRWRARHVTSRDHIELLEQLVRRAEREGRLIVSWSHHDRRVMTGTAPHLGDRIASIHRSGIPTARRWARTVHRRPITEGNELMAYLALVGYRVPQRYGPDLVGEHLRALREQFVQGRSWATLTSPTRRKWRDVVGHNRHDLLGMRRVVRLAALGLTARA